MTQELKKYDSLVLYNYLFKLFKINIINKLTTYHVYYNIVIMQ